MILYYYNNGYAHKFENSNEEYDVFLGLDSIFADLYRENKNGEIIALLKELTKSFNIPYISETLFEDFEELANFYESAIDAYIQGHAGACIESCRTCLVSIFSKYKGTKNFAKWMRGIYNTSGESTISTAQDLSQALNTELRKEDLADFFYENRAGKLTKTKAIYMIYSMMSDYGTHRNEATQENPTLEDALFSLRLMDSILFWVYSKKKQGRIDNVKKVLVEYLLW